MSLRLLRESIRAILQEAGPHAAQLTGEMPRPDTKYEAEAKKVWEFMQNPDFWQIGSDPLDRLGNMLGLDLYSTNSDQIKAKFEGKFKSQHSIADFLQSKAAQIEHESGANGLKQFTSNLSNAFPSVEAALNSLKADREKFGEGGLPGYAARLISDFADIPNFTKIYNNNTSTFDSFLNHSHYDLPREDPERTEMLKKWFKDVEDNRRKVFNAIGGRQYEYRQYKDRLRYIEQYKDQLIKNNKVLESLDPILDSLAQRIIAQIEKPGAFEVLHDVGDFAYVVLDATPKGGKRWRDLSPAEQEAELKDHDKLKERLRASIITDYDEPQRNIDNVSKEIKTFENEVAEYQKRREEFDKNIGGKKHKLEALVTKLSNMASSEEHFLDAVVKDDSNLKHRLDRAGIKFDKLNKDQLRDLFRPKRLWEKMIAGVMMKKFEISSIQDWIDNLEHEIEKVKVMYKRVKPEAPKNAPFEKYIFAQQRDDVPPEPNTPKEQEVKKKLDNHYDHTELLDEPTGKWLDSLGQKGLYKDVLEPPTRFKLAFRGLSMKYNDLEKFIGSTPKSHGVVKKNMTYKPRVGTASWSVEKKIAQDFSSKGDGDYNVVMVARIPANMFIMNPDETRHIKTLDGYSDEREVIGVGDIKVFAIEYVKRGHGYNKPGAGLKTPAAPKVKKKKPIKFEPPKKGKKK